ncbi:Vacuolar cation/proton exchanger 2 [Zea mays]|uniref:Vacuolar cation/proton exchanger 2 n=1 Tax=Zea mays TaxID=4577 RepID=A0A1D6DVN8_MAIZE|nr:Vacuolar cation/proton exchanger 2 [Zea mays]
MMMETPQIEMGGFKVNSPQVPNGVLRPTVSSSWNSRGTVERALKSIRIVIFTSKLNLLMPFGPASIILHFTTRRHGLIFLFSMLGITPLAERLGYATEQLAIYTGPTVGGLLNATFGNATEMIIAVYALKNGMIRVVQQSLLGSILSNMLLVMGCAFFAGGVVHRNKDQIFSNCSCQLRFTVDGCHGIDVSCRSSFHSFRSASRGIRGCTFKEEAPIEDIAEEDEEAEIGMWEAVTWLAVLTLWVSFLSEYLVNAIEGASDSLNLPVAFISVILLPIVGNAAEHASAIMFAMKDKLDITLGVAIGSSTQISMFVIPFCVVIGWMMGQRMDLNFQLFETATLFITVLVVAFMLQDGTANYLKGLMLILCYLIVAASFFVHVDPQSSE